MLDLTFDMQKILFTAFAIFFLQAASPVISSPQTGAALQGQVPIVGTTDVPNFSRAELTFTYANDRANTWFVIKSLSQPATDSTLAVWDTTAITDGDYTLRLRVYLLDGSFLDFVVGGLRVMNDAPPATLTLSVTDTPPYTAAPDATMPPPPTTLPVTVTPIFPTPIPLPDNPASFTVTDVYAYLKLGAFVSAFIFIVVIILFRFRRT